MSTIHQDGFPLDVIGDHLAKAGGSFEPQRQNNWLIMIPNIGGAVGGIPGAGSDDVIQLSVESASLPSVAVEEVELNFLNTRRYVAGRAVYDTIPLILKDMVDVGVATTIKSWHEEVFDPRTHKIGLATNYKRDVDLILMAPDGTLTRSWTLKGCFPLSINYGTLDMASSDKVLIEAVLRYDRALASF